MEIINILKNNSGPESIEALFKTLVDTSQAIEQQNSQRAESCEEAKEAEGDEDGTPPRQRKDPPVAYEKQFQLLLDNLSKNELLNSKKPEQPSRPLPTLQTTELMTQAYTLINEVIMHPQVMWTRNFFYSLGAMVPAQ